MVHFFVLDIWDLGISVWAGMGAGRSMGFPGGQVRGWEGGLKAFELCFK